jgi:hypothetical protein
LPSLAKSNNYFSGFLASYAEAVNSEKLRMAIFRNSIPNSMDCVDHPQSRALLSTAESRTSIDSIRESAKFALACGCLLG